LYREFLGLLLKEESPSQIQEALKILELFQLAELENFFGDDCIEGQKNKIQEVLAKTNTALIHSVILEDHTYLILQLPNGAIRRYQVSIPAQEINQKLKQWRDFLEDGTTNQYLVLSQSLYDLLIRPLESELSQASSKSLIFINDGLLRNVPMAALYDSKNEKYLIEKYPIAISLGSNLGARFSSEPSDEQEVLAFGLTVSIPPFEALPNVSKETQEVAAILGGETFLNSQFTLESFSNSLENNQLSIVHLATHGKFRGMPENSFIQAFDQPIYLKDLEAILSQSKTLIELLTLSACQTAAGNERAFLGLAGLAIRSGVKSTLGSLWSINDEATVAL
ncbi:MAG: CHAT domain-containing protein, partial [Microcystaceae cyanobacterium]